MASNEKDSPISLLETLSEIDGNLEYFAVAKDGTTYKCTPAQLKDFVLKGETPVVRIPLAVLNLSNSSSSEDILNAFGGKETFIALCEKIYGRDVVCVCQGFASDDENMKIGYVTQAISCKHIDAENAILMFLINIDNVSHRLMINCVDGTASFSKTTKKYVDEQMFLLTISDTGHQELVSNQDTTGETAATKINTVFGSADNFKSVVSQLMANKRLVIKITETERFQPGVIHSYINTDTGAYELSFDYNYSSLSSTGATLLSKRILIAMNNNYGNFFIVRDIVTSDNLTTLTKKTAAEYEAIGSKDANTVYCVTD